MIVNQRCCSRFVQATRREIAHLCPPSDRPGDVSRHLDRYNRARKAVVSMFQIGFGYPRSEGVKNALRLSTLTALSVVPENKLRLCHDRDELPSAVVTRVCQTIIRRPRCKGIVSPTIRLPTGAAKVFKEKISGAAHHRAQLHRLLKTIDTGDTIIVTRLDRLARSTRDLLNILDKIAKAGATFKSLGDAWADTTTAHGRLMLTVLGGLAEFERELIRVRTGEGRVRAKARGVHMGRPFKLNRHQQREAIARREAGEALTDIARTFGVHHTTIGRLRA